MVHVPSWIFDQGFKYACDHGEYLRDLTNDIIFVKMLPNIGKKL